MNALYEEDRRRCPPINHPAYLTLEPLSRYLRAEADELRREGRNNQVLIDIGCGQKPYRPWFSSFLSAYWGVDIKNNTSADVIGTNYNLPFKDAASDIVLCTQVLEHSEYPDKTLSEIRRIVKPGGVVMLSTHGVFIYHPSPGDYWRWTHEGLRAAFKRAGLEVVRLLPNGGPIACLFYLGATLISLFTYKSRWLSPIRWVFIPILNFIGDKLDNYLYPNNTLLLVANYFVVARRPW